jgi:hypothetical protein
MPDIRPLSFGEILDGSLTLYRRNFGLFLQLALASLSVPAALFVYFMLTKVQGFILMMMGGLVDWSLVAFMVVIGIAYGIGSLMLAAAAIRVVSDSYLGRHTSFGQALGLGASKILPLFLVGLGKWLLLTILAGVLTGAGVITFLVLRGIAGAGVAGLFTAVLVLVGCWLWVWVAVGYGVTTPVVVLEQLSSSFDAFGRSWDLTRGSRAKIVGLVIVSYLLFSFIPQLLLRLIATGVLASSPPAGMALMVVSYVVPVILYPAIACVFTLIYYDLRVRREAFDLQMLSQQLGV